MLNAAVDGLWEAADAYFHDGDYVRIVALCRISVELDQSFDEAYSSAGYLLWSMGEIPSADALLEYGTRRSKKPGQLHDEMGQQLFRTKRYADAARYLEKAIKLGGVEVSAYSSLGHSYTKLSKFEDAVRVWQLAVKKFPNYPGGPKNLKDAQERLKNGK